MGRFLRHAWLPALLALMGMAIAWVAVTAGQDVRRSRELLEVRSGVLAAQLALERARTSGVAGEELAALEKHAAERERDLRDSPPGKYGYAKFGRQFSAWDGYRYEEIAESGYVFHQPNASKKEKEDSSMAVGESERRSKNVVWYPLYPMLGRLASKALSIEAIHALTVVSWTCCLLAAVALFHYARQRAARLPGIEDLNPPALWAVVLLLFGPCSVFLYSNFTESLFTLLLVLFLICVQERNWWWAAVIAGIASASRSQGVLFGPVLALTFLVRAKSYPLPKRVLVAGALGVISATGLVCYMAFLQRQFNDPLAFMRGQIYWNVGLTEDRFEYALLPTNALKHIWKFATAPTLDLPRLWEGLCLIWPPLLLLLGRKRLSFELKLLGWMLWALPYVSNSLAGSTPMNSQWMSMGRFMAVLLPAHLIVADFLAERPRLLPFVLVPSAGLFVLFAYLYGTGAWVG